MEDVIFLKDSQSKTGPFTERQVQDWYRKKWLGGSLLITFTPGDEDSWITLDSLQSMNGIGCPFFKIDENAHYFEKIRTDKKERLESLKKEIEEMGRHCDLVPELQKLFEIIAKKLEELTMLAKQKETHNLDENETIDEQEEEQIQEVPQSNSKNGQKKKNKKKKNKKKKKSESEKSEEIDEPVFEIGSGKSTNPCYYVRWSEDADKKDDVTELRRECGDSSLEAEECLAEGDFENALHPISISVIINPRSEEVLNKYKQRLSPDQYARVVKYISSLEVDLMRLAREDENEPIDQEEKEQIQEVVESNSNSDQKKKSESEKSEEADEPMLKIGSGKSKDPCFHIRLCEGTGIVPDMVELRRECRDFSQATEEYLADGDFENALHPISITVMIDPRSEEVLDKYKQRLSPDQYARVVKHLSSMEVVTANAWVDYKKLASEVSKYHEMREQLAETKIDKCITKAEYDVHCANLSVIFQDCDIDIPRSEAFSGWIIYVIEKHIQYMQNHLEQSPARAHEVFSNEQANDEGLKVMHKFFQEHLPPKYFDLVRKEVGLITECLHEYMFTTAKDRVEINKKTSEDNMRRRIDLEKVFDILPPEHFASCVENFLSLKESLEEYIVSGTSMSNIRNHDAPNTVAGNAESNRKTKQKKIERPDSISTHLWKQFYNLGESVADFVLDAFALFESGDFSNWNKRRVKILASLIDKDNQEKTRKGRNLVCEYVLIERMKEKEFFCCVLCEEILFNWRQAFIHFASNTHREKEKCAVHSSIIEGFRGVLNAVTDLPMKLGLIDFQSYVELYSNGGIVVKNDGFPSSEFIDYLYEGYRTLGSIEVNTLTDEQRSTMEANKLVFEAETMIARAKSEMGVEAMDELHEHLGLGETHCRFCCCETGNREGFYAHLLSSTHVHNVNASMRKWENEYCRLTILVNVHKKDLI